MTSDPQATRARNQRKHTPPSKLIDGRAFVFADAVAVNGLLGRAEVWLPVRTKSEGNNRESWRIASRRALEQRTITAAWLKQLGAANWRTSVKRVLFVRLGPKQLDCDNNVGSMKRPRDQVAAWLGGNNDVKARGDDGPTSGITWTYAQEHYAKWGVRVEFYLAAIKIPDADGGNNLLVSRDRDRDPAAVSVDGLRGDHGSENVR